MIKPKLREKKQTAQGHITGGRIRTQTKAPLVLNPVLCSALQEVRTRCCPGIKTVLLEGAPLVPYISEKEYGLQQKEVRTPTRVLMKAGKSRT